MVVLGAGFGGLELCAVLSERLGGQVPSPGYDADVVLVDRAEGFTFGFAKLDVMFGRVPPAEAVTSYQGLVKPGVRFVPAEVVSIDPVARTVETSEGSLEGDVLVVALGADLDPGATPGLVEGGHEFYTVPGAFALREVLADFRGGRVVVGVTSTPFKCPPAPSEMALLVEQMLRERGLREMSEVSLVMPFGVPIPPSPAASQVLLTAFGERGIRWIPDNLVRSLDPERRVAVLSGGDEMPYDLFLGIPVHKAPAAVVQSGLTVDGWVPVDPLTLETSFPGVFAVGDVTSVGTPKAGVFAEGQASVVAARILERLGGAEPTTTYDGHGVCYLEYGHGMVAKVDVTFASGARPTGFLEGPSPDLVADKRAFGGDRLVRWFGAGA